MNPALGETAGGVQAGHRPFTPATTLAGWMLAVLVLALFMANAALHFPGVMNNDSIGQYRQGASGQYGDWHPPIMAWLWGRLMLLADGPAPMLLLHLGLYWAGFALVADAFRRTGRPALALVTVLAGAFPPFLYVNAQVVKDVGMAVSWLAALGVLSWFRLQDRRVPALAAVVVGLLLFYGTMVRTNAVFGLGPLLLYALAPRHWLRNTRLLVAIVVVAVVALPASMLANRLLFQPKQEHAVQSLFLFDLAGMAVHTGNPGLLEPRASFTADELRACYTPYWWDSLSPWGRCAARVHRPAGEEMPTLGQGLAQQWYRTIFAHPLAYAQHRLKHFNSALLFAVPAKHIRFTPEYSTKDPAVKPLEVVTARDVKFDLLRKNPAVWPVVWLTWSAGLLVLLRPETGSNVALARVLAASAIGYSCAYLLIGVATDMRYHYWSLLAAMLASLAAWPQLTAQARRRTPALVITAAVVAAVVGTGVLTRLLDVRVLV